MISSLVLVFQMMQTSYLKATRWSSRRLWEILPAYTCTTYYFAVAWLCIANESLFQSFSAGLYSRISSMEKSCQHPSALNATNLFYFYSLDAWGIRSSFDNASVDEYFASASPDWNNMLHFRIRNTLYVYKLHDRIFVSCCPVYFRSYRCSNAFRWTLCSIDLDRYSCTKGQTKSCLAPLAITSISN